MECKKRLRSYNFTYDERERLLRIVEQRLSEIECKKIDAASMRRKAEEWNRVEKEFNLSASSYVRHVDSLRKCWDNMKKKSRRYVAQQKYILQSGLEIPNFKKDRILEAVNKLISRPREEYKQHYQQNQELHQQQQQYWESDPLLIEIVDNPPLVKYADDSFVVEEDSTNQSHSWSQWSPSVLRQSTSSIPPLDNQNEPATSSVTNVISTPAPPAPQTSTISLVSVKTLLADSKNPSSSASQQHVQQTVSISGDSTTPSLTFGPSPENPSLGSIIPSLDLAHPSTSRAPPILQNTRDQPIQSTQHRLMGKCQSNIDEATEKQLIKEKIATEKLQRRMAIREHKWKHEEHLQEKKLKALLIRKQQLKIKLLTVQINENNK